MLGKSVVIIALVAGFVAVASAQKWMKADGYDRKTCAPYNTDYKDVFNGRIYSCDGCCKAECGMTGEILFDAKVQDNRYCACKAEESLDLMDRTCVGLDLSESGCGLCCKQSNKSWEVVKAVNGKEECRCKGPWVETPDPDEEPKKRFHFFRKNE